MSERWWYYCADCDRDSGAFNINHGQNVLRDVARHWSALRDIYRNAGWLDITVLGHGSGGLNWLDEHDGHRVLLQSEFGKREALTYSHELTEFMMNVLEKLVPPDRPDLWDLDALTHREAIAEQIKWMWERVAEEKAGRAEHFRPPARHPK